MTTNLPYMQVELYSCSAHDLDDYLSRMRIEHLSCSNPFKCKSGSKFNGQMGQNARRFFIAFPVRFEVVKGALVLQLDCEQFRLELQSGKDVKYTEEDMTENGMIDTEVPYIPVHPNWEGDVPKFGLLGQLPLFLRVDYERMA